MNLPDAAHEPFMLLCFLAGISLGAVIGYWCGGESARIYSRKRRRR